MGGGDFNNKAVYVQENKKGLFVSQPSYEGKIYTDTADSVIREVFAAHQKGIQFRHEFRFGNMMSAMVRNWMVGRFLQTDYSHIAFVDFDVHFPTGTLVRLMERDVDICGAAYPYRGDPLDFPMAWLGAPGSKIYSVDPKTGKEDKAGLIEVSGIPTGCLVIKRNVLEKMIEMRPDLSYYEPALESKKAFSLFEWVRKNDLIFTEDYAFCYLARECGFRVWLDPDIDMRHVGPKRFDGNIGKWLEGAYAAEEAAKVRTDAMSDGMKKILKFNDDIAAEAKRKAAA